MRSCQRDSEAIGGAREENASVAAVGGDQGRWGGRVPEGGWRRGGDEGYGGGGAAFEGGTARSGRLNVG